MIPVAFDLRDPDRSGIARVARSMARAFAEGDSTGRYDLRFAGPIAVLNRMNARDWGQRPSKLISWESGRLSARAEVDWSRVSAAVGDSVWYFPHFDVPWLARPRRSIVAIHDLIALRVPGATTRLRRTLAREWIRHSASRASRIVVGTNFTRQDLADQWPHLAAKISVVPHGIDPQFLRTPAALPPAIDRLVDGAPYMLSVGNKKPHKNLEMGVEVLRRLPTLRWVVVGESFWGWDRVMARINEFGVGDRVHVLEPQSDLILHSLYAHSACLFFPSRHEGFGLPILEALASGTRVVVGAAGASIEVLGRHGTVCGLDDPDAFAEAVRACITADVAPDPAGRAHAATYTWEKAATAIARLVDEVSTE